MILQFLESQPRVIDGAGMALAPGTVADASRSVEWWRRDRGGKVRNVAYDFNRARSVTTTTRHCLGFR